MVSAPPPASFVQASSGSDPPQEVGQFVTRHLWIVKSFLQQCLFTLLKVKPEVLISQRVIVWRPCYGSFIPSAGRPSIRCS